MRSLILRPLGWRRALRSPPQRRRHSTRHEVGQASFNGRPHTKKWRLHRVPVDSRPSGAPKGSRQAYILPMFPYPSGTLHLGHLRVYTISDVLARFKRMQGYTVLHPIGWDAFGLPAENAAIERGIHPEKWTLQNIDAMRKQIKEMGGQWSWDREIRTCDPDFYKHTQRIFLMLHERGLAYQAESLVNYDPVDQTVLANEQVDANGCSWRSGAKAEQKMLKQWFLKIKEFQGPLLDDLDTLAVNGRWPERVLAMQRNWIGRSVGTKIGFDIADTRSQTNLDPVDVFTTRADTLFGVMYAALSLGHSIVRQCAQKDEGLRKFIERAKTLPPDTKEGYLLQGIKARNPIADLVKDENVEEWVPVYAAPYVLDDYGSGAVMGVPAHDSRDYAFWRHNGNRDPVRHVIAAEPLPSPSAKTAPESLPLDKPMLEKGYVVSTDPNFGNEASDQAVEKMIQLLQNAGKSVERTENWRLRDWLISRQRYWGTPIPIIHCNSCGAVPVPETDLPVKLPNLPDAFFQGRRGNPLAEDEEWKKTSCPKCGSAAERETDTMDTFMDSSWYFFRFLDPQNSQLPVKATKANHGMPVGIYIGGVEHAILHLLYARFISKFLATTSLWPAGKSVHGEPFRQLITQGMVHGKTYSDPATGRFLRPEEMDLSKPSKPIIRGTNIAPTISYEKMSKSKHNGVDPSATIAEYGADATRAHMLFQAPVGDVLEWDEQKIVGVQRWLARVSRLCTAFWFPRHEVERFQPPEDINASVMALLELHRKRNDVVLEPQEIDLVSKLQGIIASVTRSYDETYSLNTVVSDLMTLTNTIWDTPHASSSTPWLKWLATVHLLRMLAPIAPGVAQKGWEALHHATNPITFTRYLDVFAAGFPVPDTTIQHLLSASIRCVVQVNGKRRFQTDIKNVPEDVPADNEDAVKEWVLEQLLQTELGQRYMHPELGVLWKADGFGEPDPRCKYVPAGWSVVVARWGKIVNLVGPEGKTGGKGGKA